MNIQNNNSKMVNFAQKLVGRTLHSDDNMCIKLINPNNLVTYLIENLLVIPPIQRPLNENKVNDIVSRMCDNLAYNWLLSQGRISIGAIENSDCYYVLDGQHRLEALLKLLNQQRINNEPLYSHVIEIIVVKFNSINDMNRYYRDINVNSAIEPMYDFVNDHVIQNTLKQIKLWLLENYRHAFRRNKNIIARGDNNLHIDEWMNLFSITDIKNLYRQYNRNYTDSHFLRERILFANDLARAKYNNYFRTNQLADYIIPMNYHRNLVNTNFYLSHGNVNFMDVVLGISQNIVINNKNQQ